METGNLEHHVDAKTFKLLLVSHRRLIRADDRMEGLRGLRDIQTGELFLTEERRLFNHDHLVART